MILGGAGTTGARSTVAIGWRGPSPAAATRGQSGLANNAPTSATGNSIPVSPSMRTARVPDGVRIVARRMQPPDRAGRGVTGSMNMASRAAAGASRRPHRPFSDDSDVLGLLPLLARHDVELDALALLQGPVAISLDRREVDEHVVTLLAGDEPVALLSVEEFHSTCRQRTLFSS